MPVIVAQASSLLYRGFPIRMSSSRGEPHLCCFIGDRQEAADWKSATQQVGNLRYQPRAPSKRAQERIFAQVEPKNPFTTF
jgi:hypothetical protein